MATQILQPLIWLTRTLTRCKIPSGYREGTRQDNGETPPNRTAIPFEEGSSGMWTAAITAFLQVLVFSAVPFLVYLVRRRTSRGFMRYVGLYAPDRRTLLWATFLVLLVTPLMLWAFSTPGLREMAVGPATTAGLLRSLGASGESFFLLLLYAWVQTALAEEILFRGFIAQRLIERLGFALGNLVQALFFGLLHLGLFLALSGQTLTLLRSGMLILAPTAMGWALGYIKIKLGNGSILPGWWAHGLANFIAFSVMAFVWA